MKITTDRVLETIKYGAMGQLVDASQKIMSASAKASIEKPVAIGNHTMIENFHDGFGGDHFQQAILLSLLFDEIAALRKEVRALRKGKKGAAQ